MKILVKRVYEPADAADGRRILVDRLWPRGIAKEHASWDEWLKEIAPSSELRRWSHHDPEKWPEFAARYARELDQRPELVGYLRDLAAKAPLTLLYAARDTERNNAVALRDYLLVR
ncbi:DUF488 domain-containing protein [Chelatococcus sp. GCM10030263]|uniref:DUF488 domain-containing protein n=1 Tax=Chelatococcus sp. GCM10030263 TaxID=3273387 RepID=UPI00361F3479